MKKKILVIIVFFIIILFGLGLVTSFKDGARVRNGIEPKYTIKVINNDGSKITYWGLGYKVIRYINESLNEPFKNNIGVKYGNWFMKYEIKDEKHLVIDCNKLDRLLNDGAVLIDVRIEEEYAMNHLNGAINIPVDEILDGVMALDINKKDIIILYCNSGNRSIGGYRELINNGYENVYDLGAFSKCESK